MSGELQDYCLEYIRCCAVLNHLRKHDGTFEELSVIMGELETLKVKMRRELSK